MDGTVLWIRCNLMENINSETRKCRFCHRNQNEAKIIYTERFGEPMYLCDAHYYQGVRTGRFRNLKSQNEIIEHDDYLEVYLYNRKGDKIASTLVDKEHRDLIEKYKWGLKTYPNRYTSYVVTNAGGERYSLHELIIKRLAGERPPKATIDHANRNGLDNRNENLSYSNQTYQNYNQKINNRNKSGIKGVCFSGGYWYAQISYNGKHYKKNYKDKEKAIRMRKIWEEIVADKDCEHTEKLLRRSEIKGVE